MKFIAVCSYRAARRRYPRAAIICRVAGGFIAFAGAADHQAWRAMQ